jgi:hypothetical protein
MKAYGKGQRGDAAYGTDGNVLISVQIPTELREELLQLALENERTFSAEVRLAMKAHVQAARAAA